MAPNSTLHSSKSQPSSEIDDQLSEILLAEEKLVYAGIIKRNMQNRLLGIKIVGFVIVIVLFLIPTFNFVINLAALASNREENIIIIFAIFIILFTLILLITIAQDRFFMPTTLAFIIIWLSFSSEPNIFFAVLKFLFALFLFEIPNIQRFYKRYLDYYSTSASYQIEELVLLRILFDKQITLYLRIGILIVGITWMILALVFQPFNIDLGGEGGISIPIIGLTIIVIYLVFSPKILLSAKQRFIGKEKSLKTNVSLEF